MPRFLLRRVGEHQSKTVELVSSQKIDVDLRMIDFSLEHGSPHDRLITSRREQLHVDGDPGCAGYEAKTRRSHRSFELHLQNHGIGLTCPGYGAVVTIEEMRDQAHVEL